MPGLYGLESLNLGVCGVRLVHYLSIKHLAILPEMDAWLLWDKCGYVKT